MGRHRKCSRSCFKVGNVPWNLGKKVPREKQSSYKLPQTVRLTPELYKKVSGAGVTGGPSYRLLRPMKGNTPKEEESSLKTTSDRADADVYHLFHVGETEKLFNKAFREHAKASVKCNGDLVLDIETEQQCGLSWTERLKCTDCKYLSKYHKLYKEVEGSEARK